MTPYTIPVNVPDPTAVNNLTVTMDLNDQQGVRI